MVAMRMLEDGEDRLVSFCAVANGNPWVLASADPGDKPALADLKNRSILDVANVGTANMAFRWLAERAGLGEGDLDLRTGSGDEAADLDAVVSGRVRYAFHSLHALAPTLATGRLHLALDLAPPTGVLPWSTYLARPERMAAEPEAFAAFVRAIARAQNWMATHSGEETARVVSFAYPDYPLDALALGLRHYTASGVLPSGPAIERGPFDRFSTLLVDIGWLKRPASFEELVEIGPAQAAATVIEDAGARR
jgi:NitT/TauT family transport system substrate-binding protein